MLLSGDGAASPEGRHVDAGRLLAREVVFGAQIGHNCAAAVREVQQAIAGFHLREDSTDVHSESSGCTDI